MQKNLNFIFFLLFAISTLSYGKINIDHLELFPQDTYSQTDNSKNVIQGISFYKEYIFTTQSIRKHKKDIGILFNILDANGSSIANKELPIASHGYDLSIEYLDRSYVYLYTVGEHSNNALRFKVKLPKSTVSTKFSQKLDIILDHKFRLPKEYRASTGITLNEDKNYLLAISRKYIKKLSKIEVTSGHINIYDKQVLLSNTEKILYSIPMIKEQITHAVQGIAMSGDLIYTLSGNNKPNDRKMLVIYHKKKGFVKKYYLMRPSNMLDKWSKWELEGLAIYNNMLITTINAKKKNSNRRHKYILTLLPML